MIVLVIKCIIVLILMCRGREFPGGETTVATMGRVCTGKAVGVSVDVNPFEPHILASNLAHAIGHNLGFGHDDVPNGLGKFIWLKKQLCNIS